MSNYFNPVEVDLNASVEGSYGTGTDWQLYQIGTENRYSFLFCSVLFLIPLSMLIVKFPFWWMGGLFLYGCYYFYDLPRKQAFIGNHLFFVVKWTLLPPLAFLLLTKFLIWLTNKDADLAGIVPDFTSDIVNYHTWLGALLRYFFT